MVDWDAIVARDGPAVWRTAYRLVGNRADAEDCFQETFLAALPIFRRERVECPQALLQRLATARALDRLRRRYRRARRESSGLIELTEVRSDDLPPPQLAESAELSERLRAALSTLPPKQAQAFCLFYLDGWDYLRIAGHLDASVSGVGVLLHRARRRLRELLAEYPLAEPTQPGK
jgi:RNA polymerase sigma-70 factor (ECF subfamily)